MAGRILFATTCLSTSALRRWKINLVVPLERAVCGPLILPKLTRCRKSCRNGRGKTPSLCAKVWPNQVRLAGLNKKGQGPMHQKGEESSLREGQVTVSREASQSFLLGLCRRAGQPHWRQKGETGLSTAGLSTPWTGRTRPYPAPGIFCWSFSASAPNAPSSRSHAWQEPPARPTGWTCTHLLRADLPTPFSQPGPFWTPAAIVPTARWASRPAARHPPGLTSTCPHTTQPQFQAAG